MKAVILCGGLGERLRPLTERTPKVMLDVKGKPILEYTLEYLKKFGLKDIILLCGHKHEEIENYFEDGSKFGVKIKYSIEKDKLGTAGAIKNAEKLIDTDFIIINGDVLTNFPLNELIAAFKKTNRNVMTLVKPNNPFGIARISETEGKICKIDEFVEKPKMKEWINAGYIVLKHPTLALFPEKGEAEKMVYPKLQEQGVLMGFLIGDKYFWKSVDSIKDLKELNAGVA